MKPITHKSLPNFGAAVQAVLFLMAGIEFFPNPIIGAIIGLGVGAVVNYSIALASSRISEISDKRKPLAYKFLAGMLLLSPVTITLSLYYPETVFAGIAWALCVDVSIVLAGAISGKSLFETKKPKKVKGNKPQAKGKKEQEAQVLPQEAKPLPKVARKRITDAELLAYLAEHPKESHDDIATHFGVTRQAIGPRIKKFKPIQIDQSLLIKEKSK